MSEQDNPNKNWFDVDGDNTLALDWPINEKSHVWEIGGFEGRWAAQIRQKFNCHVTIFEPQLWAARKLFDRFGNHPDVNLVDIRPYGLALENGVMEIGDYHTDGASVLKPGVRDTGLGYFKGFYQEVLHFPNEIDLCLMNIEGYEYELLPSFIVSGVIGRFKAIWVQFHPSLIEGSHPEVELQMRDYIYERMEETHDILWDYFPTAVAWERRNK